MITPDGLTTSSVQPNFKIRPWRSQKYRQFVGSLGCLVCGKPAVPHHHQEIGEGKMGGKVGDEKCVPLCHWHHADLHNYGREMWRGWGHDPAVAITRTQKAWEQKHGTRPWE